MRDLPTGYLDTCNRIVSILHALFCIVSTTYYFLTTSIYIECGGSTTALEYSILVVSTGYLCYDLLCMMYLGILDLDGTFHHSMAIIVSSLLIILDSGTNYWVGVLAMSEVSIPFLHMRCILRTIGLSKTKAFYLCEDLYFGLYFIGRALVGSVLIWNIMICDSIFILLKIAGFPLEIRSLYFIW